MNEKRRLIFLGQISGYALTFACLAQAVSAQEDISRTISDFKSSSLSYEYNSEASFFGSGTLTRNSKDVGKIDEISSSASFIVSRQLGDAFLLRLGPEWQYYSFDTKTTAAIPNVVQGVDLAVGLDWQVTPAIIARIQAHPGIYSNFARVSLRQFNAPFEIGGTYFVSPDLQFFAGIGVDINRDALIPAIPAVGFRWKMADKWVLYSMLPRPQLQYSATDNLKFFVGADLRDSTFRMDDEFGHTRGVKELDNAVLDYTEVRTGGGATWQVTKAIGVDLEGGCVPYRRFSFPRANYKVLATDPVPYVRIGISAKF